MTSVTTPQAAVASATMNALRQTGMSLGIALLGSLMSLQATRHLHSALLAQAYRMQPGWRMPRFNNTACPRRRL